MTIREITEDKKIIKTEKTPCLPNKDFSPEVDGKAPLSVRGFPRWKILLLVILCLSNMFAQACFTLMGPFFPREATAKNVSGIVIGLIFGCFQIVIIVSSPIFGSLISVIGAKFLYVSGLFVCGSCSVLFGLLDRSPPGITFIVLALVTRSVEALGVAAFLTSSRAIAGNAFPENVATIYGFLSFFIGIGLMLGYPFGGLLYQFGGFGTPFWTLGAVVLLCAVVSYLVMPPEVNSNGVTKKRCCSLFGLYRSPTVWLASCITFSCSFHISIFVTTYSRYLIEKFGFSPALIGVVFLASPAAYTIASPIFGRIVDTKGYHMVFMTTMSFVTIVAVMMWGPSPLLKPLGLFPNIWVNILSQLLCGVTMGCMVVTAVSSIFKSAKELGYGDNINTHGMVSGIYVMSFGSGSFVGPVFGGMMMEYAGFEWSLTVVAGIFLIMGVLGIALLVHRRKSTKDEIVEKNIPLKEK